MKEEEWRLAPLSSPQFPRDVPTEASAAAAVFADFCTLEVLFEEERLNTQCS